MLSTGFGVRIDVNEADRLLNLAAKSGHKQAHEVINSGYLQKVGQLLARVFCRRPAVSKISQVQIEVKEQIVEQKRADTPPRKNKRAQQDAKTDIDQASETTSDVSESTSHTLLKQFKSRYPQSKEKKGKSNYLCELLGIIKHYIDDDDWTDAFNEIERKYNSKTISSARSTILNDLVKELVNAYPKKFGKFLIELASREKHVDLFKYVFGLTLHNKIKQLVSDKLVIYDWIKAKLDADIEIYAILDAIKTYHHDKKPDNPLQTELVDVLQQAKVEVLKAHQSDSFVNQQVAALDILPCYTEKQKALFKPKEPEQLVKLFEQLRNAVSQQPERKQIDEVKPKASVAVASVAQHVESSVEAVETKIHPPTIAQKEKQKCIPLLSKITIPPDAAWLMQMIRTISKYRVRLKGSRVYNPVVDEVDDLRRDIDLETDAPWELITLLLWAYKEIQVNVMSVGTEGASIELCKFKGWSKGHSIDIHCSADLEYVSEDMIHRMMWADENGNCYGMTSNADDANKMKVLAFTCDTKQFFINNPARILSTVLALSNGFKFSAEENEMHIANLRAALPALAELVKTNPERLLFPLLKNFTRGNAVENVRLLHSFGVFNTLFPTTGLDKDEQEFVIGEHKKIFMTFDSAYKTGLHFSLWNLYGRILAAYLRPVMAMTPEVIDKALDDKIAEIRLIGCQTKRLAEIKAFAKKYLVVMHKRHQASLVTNAKNRHIAGEVSETCKDVPQQLAVAVSLSVEHKM